MAKNPPANAGHTGTIPGPGSFHMPQGNQAHDKTAEPVLWGPSATTMEARAPQQEKSPRWDVPAPQLERSLCSPQLEKAQPRTPSTAQKYI